MTQLTTGAQPSRTGAGEHMVPDGFETIRGCRYVAGYLEHSAAISGAAAAASFAAALNSAPTGFSVPPTDTYLKELCRNPRAAPGEADDLGYNDAEAHRLEADHPTGPSVSPTR